MKVWMLRCLVAAVLVVSSLSSVAQPPAAEQRAARYMESVRADTPQLTAFLREMPKGGDLHNHLSGSIYAESFIQWAMEADQCVNLQSLYLAKPPCNESAGTVPVKRASADPTLYRRMIDAWSMRNWETSGQSGHDHFFDSFAKFGIAGDNRTGDMLAEVAVRAAENHEQYQELMFNPANPAAVAQQVGWMDDLAAMRQALLSRGLVEVITAGTKFIDDAENRRNMLLQCGGSHASPGCRVEQRYIYQVLRGAPREQVFAQILAGFEMASRDGRVVGFNLVMPEDTLIPMRDYDLHMHIIDFLKPMYPKVHVSLHAGELASGLVPPEGLRSHIRKAVEVGHAERIGHGVSVAYEDHALALMKDLAQRNVMIEINLTSNAVILGVRGKDHPLAAYMKSGVPVALSTDDEGVSRSDLTMEYLRGVREQGLSYLQLKKMARTSLEHAFAPGRSLWATAGNFSSVRSECAADFPTGRAVAASCVKFLESSDKARLEWELESSFRRFEAQW